MQSSAAVITSDVSERFAMYQGDCCDVVKGLPDASIGFSISSIPFASLYTYSASPRDMGNSKDHAEFYQHFKYLIPEWLRVTKPGRLNSIHCMNLPTSKARDGYIGIKDFRGNIINDMCGSDAADMKRAADILMYRAVIAKREGDNARALKLDDQRNALVEELTANPGEHGWIYHSEVCIWKDPVTAMQRTKALGLLHKQIKKDSCMSRQGIPDYLVTFRKPGENPEPVTHTDSSYPVKLWQRVASPIWMSTFGAGTDHAADSDGFAIPHGGDNDTDHGTIQPGDTLQRESAREERDERHICPLQLSVIRRALRLWTNPDDVVLSPFAGIGSEGYVSLQEGRRFIGVELKESYYKQAVANLRSVEGGKSRQRSLFE